jgi:hypothetical protein
MPLERELKAFEDVLLREETAYGETGIKIDEWEDKVSGAKVRFTL